MRKRRMEFGLVISVGCLMGLWDPGNGLAQLSKKAMPAAAPAKQQPPAPAAPPPPAAAQLPPLAQLGKQIFFDATLSNPAGMSCATCHAPTAGFTYPVSQVNAQLGTAPGAVQGRFGNRKVPTVSYVAFSPVGPVFDQNFRVWTGGFFWDGRASTLAAQPAGPLFNPNEMNNIVNGVAAPNLVVQAIAKGPYANQFKQVFGANVFNLPPAQVIPLIGSALAAWESSTDVVPFNSKYDNWRAGKVQLSPSELNGLALVTGSTTGRPGGPANGKNATCVQCHGVPAIAGGVPDLWSSYRFLNTGVPRNPNNPYYAMTNSLTNPLGYNPLGVNYLDVGLGDFLYPAKGLPIANVGIGGNGLGDFLAINGTFKVPTLRNTDKRPAAGFVKAYGHNGFFKSLPQIVHFYNTRNLTTQPGEVIDFTKANPYAGLVGQPLWPAPEYVGVTLRNPTGAAGQIGNLGLAPQDEADIVNFLTALSDP